MKTLCKKIIILIFIFTTLLGTTLPTNVVYAEDETKGWSYYFDETIDEYTPNTEDYEGYTIIRAKEGGYLKYFDSNKDGMELLRVTIDGDNYVKDTSRTEMFVVDTPSGDGVYELGFLIEKDAYYLIKNENVSEYKNKLSTTQDWDKSTIKDKNSKKTSFFETVEHMISWYIRTAANGLVKLIDWAVGGGEGVTIDKIIFNQ